MRRAVQARGGTAQGARHGAERGRAARGPPRRAAITVPEAAGPPPGLRPGPPLPPHEGSGCGAPRPPPMTSPPSRARPGEQARRESAPPPVPSPPPHSSRSAVPLQAPAPVPPRPLLAPHPGRRYLLVLLAEAAHQRGAERRGAAGGLHARRAGPGAGPAVSERAAPRCGVRGRAAGPGRADLLSRANESYRNVCAGRSAGSRAASTRGPPPPGPGAPLPREASHSHSHSGPRRRLGPAPAAPQGRDGTGSAGSWEPAARRRRRLPACCTLGSQPGPPRPREAPGCEPREAGAPHPLPAAGAAGSAPRPSAKPSRARGTGGRGSGARSQRRPRPLRPQDQKLMCEAFGSMDNHIFLGAHKHIIVYLL